ncbi:MAG: multicomponent Na+:H+ antiporter subunit E [Salinirussus sp.]|jgi:multicomponent Na+:H+ antiporter subunit E
MVRRWPVFGVSLGVLWLFVRGPPLTPGGLLAEFLPGVGFGLPVAYLLRNFYSARLNLTGTLRAIPPTVAYAALFGKKLLTANVDVAYRVLAPSMPIDPAVVEVPLRVQSDLAVTTIANSISLTPGTLTMDHDDDTNTLYIHAISGDRDSVVEPIRSWEDYALRIFAEEREPGDPVPPRPSARASPAVVDAPPERPTGDTPGGADTSGDRPAGKRGEQDD